MQVRLYNPLHFWYNDCMQCKRCGAPIELRKSGPSGVYCSGRCRVAAHRARKRLGVPVELRRVRRWCAADGKRPVQVDGVPASSTNPATWDAYNLVKNKPHGFMLGAGFGCIDLDHCISDGVVAPWALAIVEAAAGCYVEVSKSGTGLHIFGLLPEQAGRVFGCVEVYAKSRFIVVTGDVYQPGGLESLEFARLKALELFASGAVPLR